MIPLLETRRGIIVPLGLVDDAVSVQSVTALAATTFVLRGAVCGTRSVVADSTVAPLDAHTVASESVVGDSYSRAVADIDAGVAVVPNGVSFDHLVTTRFDEDAEAGVVLRHVVTEAAESHTDVGVDAVTTIVYQAVTLDDHVVTDDHVNSAAAPAWIASDDWIQVQVVLMHIVVEELYSV
jgi:hypothetical protein